MDNQATRAIKEYLITQNCALQLVEPHNHRVNAAERAIQTFKNRFIGALGTTDIVNSLSNYGTNWPHKSKAPSSSWDHRVSIQLNQHTRSSKDRTTGTGTLWPRWEHGLSSTMTQRRGNHGHRVVSTHGYLTRCQSWSITINCFFNALLLLVTIKLIL
jgi:hypothetical protein